MKKKNEFDFWKENKLDQKFTLTIAEMQERFKTWMNTKEFLYIQVIRSERMIRDFITSKEGLDSVFDEPDFDEIYLQLNLLINEHYQERKKQTE